LTAAAVLFAVAALPARAQVCTGDCNDNGQVAVNELVIGINIGLGLVGGTACPALEEEDGTVPIDEMITAVDNALNGCPGAVPSATPTEVETEEPTATPTEASGTATTTPEATATVPVGGTETATPEATETTTPEATVTSTEVPSATPTQLPTETGTPEPDLDVVAGATTAALNGVNAIPNLISAIVAGVVGPGGAGQGSGAGVDTCELGGTVTDSGSLTGANGLTITLDMCEVSRPGGSVLFHGTVNVRITNVIQVTGTATADVRIVFKDGLGATTLTTTANLSAAVDLAVRLAGPADTCDFEVGPLDVVLTQVLMTLNGDLSSETADGTLVTMTFDDTMANLAIQTYGAGCVPTEYTLELDGGAQVVQFAGGGGGGAGTPSISFSLFFVDFIIDAESGSGMSQVEMSGKITADCFGGTVTLSTPERIQLLLGEFCPENGTVDVQDLGDIFYNDGGVTVDSDDAEPMMYPTCLDPALLACIG
jgi:hypothetical protein